MYPMNDVVKYGSLNQLTFFICFFMERSMSNFRHRAMKIPGITISPNPSMLNFSTPQLLIQGKSSLMGISSFLATVTITSVPQTQKISQKNKNHSSKKPTLKLARSIFLKAIMEKSTPKTLFNAQYLVEQYKTTGTETRIVQIILATEISKSSIQRRDFRNLGGFTCLRTLRYWSGKGRLTSSRLLDDIMVAMLNWMVSRVFTRLQLTYLQIRQKPNRNADATMGNLSASFCPIRSLSLPLSSSTMVSSLDLLSFVDIMVPRQTQQELLISSWGKTGSRWRNPPRLASRMSTDAMVRLRMKIVFVVVERGWDPTFQLIFYGGYKR